VPGQVDNLSCVGNDTRSLPATNCRAAFTLVELLIVVVIAIILMAVTLPTIKYSLEEGKLREGARQMNGFFASAKAQATSTGRPAGVWFELERIGDPTTALGVYQCSQIYLAEVPSPYSGDVQNARAVVRNTSNTGDPNYDTNLLPNPYQIPLTQQPMPPLTGWCIDFLNAASVGSLTPNQGALIARGERFSIRFDNKGLLFQGIRSDSDGYYYIINYGNMPPRGNGLPTGMNPNPNAGYSYQIYRQPQRIGQPLELPQGIVVDMSYSGVSPTGYQFEAAKQRLLVMFSPTGGVASVSYVHQQTNSIWEDTETSKLFLLVGRTEKMEIGPAFTNVAAANLADGANLWVAVNRRTGSVATVENVPDINPQSYNPPQPFPPTTPQQRQNFIARSREFAAKSDVKGGQ
jgi:type II secretory pathway pseudopilin PulG